MKKFFASFVLFAISHPAFSQDYFMLGKQAYAKQNYVEAEKLFNKALTTSQNNWSCRYFLASSLVYQNEIAKAKQEYTKIITYAPNSKEASLSRESLVNLNKQASQNPSASKEIFGENYLSYVKYKDNYVKWPNHAITVYIQPSEFGILINQSFLTWQKATDDYVKFAFVNSPKDADIKVYFTDKPIVKEEGTELGHAIINCAGTNILNSEIQLMTKNPQTGEDIGENLLFSTSLHEIAHALGIQGHSPNEEDLMSAKNFGTLKTPTKRDVTTLKMLYKNN